MRETVHSRDLVVGMATRICELFRIDV